MSEFRGLIDRPFTSHIKNFDKMVTELSKYMTEQEIDQCVGFMNTLSNTKHDVNPSVEDCKTQLQIMFGRDRFMELTKRWSSENQKFLTVFGTKKFRHKETHTYWDGLDPHDNPDDYEVVYI